MSSSVGKLDDGIRLQQLNKEPRPRRSPEVDMGGIAGMDEPPSRPGGHRIELQQLRWHCSRSPAKTTLSPN
jgi:hypothetical protein